jgi:hypothetical protein
MPRVNRLERAIEHPNPVVGCIMVVQEKIRFLGRSLLRCRCTEYEEDMASLRTELSLLRELYQTQRNSLRRLQHHGQEALAQYRRRISSLLQVNSQRLVLERPQRLAAFYEIMALRRHVRELHTQLVREDIVPNPPSSIATSEWEMTLATPPSWSVSSAWQANHPGQKPEYNPNPPSSRVMYPPPREESK